MDANSVIRKFRITAADGKAYTTNHYNLDAIISVGYRVNSVRATQFSRDELLQALALSDRKSFRERYLKPALDADLIEMTLPDRPSSRLQQYRLTESGRRWVESK